MSSVGDHEALEDLSVETRDMLRGIVAMIEEPQAIDGYKQGAGACSDPALKSILEHKRDDEKEHAAMVLEWILRHDGKFSGPLNDCLFSEKPIADK